MAYIFGDGFDCYATVADALSGYWDGGLGAGASNTLVAGRFTGSQAHSYQGSPFVFLIKNSTVTTDPVHHIVVAFRQTAALSGTTLGAYFQFSDGATNQCCIVFRSDGAILLTSATPAGTVLDTYTGAVTAANAWFAFEFEVVINNTTGSWAVRKNGNTSNDHALGSLNTRPGVNAQANKLSVGMNATVANQQIDDLLWRSDAASVAWVGDVRCYTRLPASDATAVFSRSPSSVVQTSPVQATTPAIAAGTVRYTPFVATYSGTIGTATVNLGTGYTGNMKCSIFASFSSAPAAVLGSASVVTNPANGVNTFTFGTPVTVAAGTQYWLGFDSDTSSGTWSMGAGTTGLTSITSYASFPVASPSVSVSQTPVVCSWTLTLNASYQLVNEAQQDGTTSYVYDSTVNDADFYNIAALPGTPISTVAVTTRGFVEKSDAGTRSAAVQLKSGATTVASTSTALSTSFGWLWRTDAVDPNTSAPWTAVAVNSAQIGPTVTL